MASERQIAANRRNALKSTGSRSEAGRARSRMNALKHGLSRTLPPAQGADPRVPPLARAILGEGVRDPLEPSSPHVGERVRDPLALAAAEEGVRDPLALAAAEEVAALSLTLASLHRLRASLVADASGSWLRASCGPDEVPAGADPISELRALARLDATLARLRGDADRR